MKKALIVDCCIRGEASRTKRILEAFLDALPEKYEIKRLVLSEEGISYLSPSSLADRDALIAKKSFDHPRFSYAREFAEADLIVMAAPFWDLSFPALLKIYIEQVSVDGITFHATESGLQGLCKAEKLIFITTRGGSYGLGSGLEDMEMGSRYLKALHIFFGIGDYHLIAANGLDIVGADTEAIVNAASGEAASLAGSL